jgi:hypothetical protein
MWPRAAQHNPEAAGSILVVYLKRDRSKLVEWLSELLSEHRSGLCSMMQAARVW